MAGGGSDLHAVALQLGPAGGGDGGAVSHSSQSANGGGGDVVTGSALQLRSDQNGGLAGVSGSSTNDQILQNGLRAVVIDAVGLLVEGEAVVDQTALAPSCYRTGFLSCTSHGFP